VNPRIGRSFNLIAAAFLYISTATASISCRSFIAQDKLAFLPGLVLPHIIAVGVVVLLFGYQLSLFGVFRRGFRTKAAAA